MSARIRNKEKAFLLPDDSRIMLARELCGLIGDVFVFTTKMYNFHWNVTGQIFEDLHEMFQDDYEAARDLLDVIAERIRSLGFSAPTTASQLVSLASLTEQPELLDWRSMVQETISDHEKSAERMNSIANMAGQLGDQATVDFLGAAALREEKRAWLYRSILLTGPQPPAC